METQAMEFEQWEVVQKLLPQGWEELARSTGALTRARGVSNASALLRVLMLHAANGLSLKDAIAQANLGGLSEMSSVSLHGRLKKAEPWLRQLCVKLLEEQAGEMVLDGTRRWRVLDASQIKEKGPTGSTWRLHYSLELPSLRCDHFELSSQKKGETLRHWELRAGEVILADRGYSHRSGAAMVVQAGADIIVRWSSSSFPLLDENGQALKVLPWLAQAPRARAFERKVWFEHEGRRYAARLCAVRKSDAAAQRSLEKAQEKNRSRPYVLSRGARQQTGFILILTTLPEEEFSCARILEIYRCRWQVELAFKRLKTLLELGHLPKTHPQTAQAWLLAKLLAALLTEKTLRQAQLFSPWGYTL